MGSRYGHCCIPQSSNQTDLVKRTDISIDMAVPPVHPAGDSTQIDTERQFAGISKGLIVRGLEVWSEENKDEA